MAGELVSFRSSYIVVIRLDVSRLVRVDVGHRWTSAMSTRFFFHRWRTVQDFCCTCGEAPWNSFDLRFKVRRGREQGVVAPLLRRKRPRPGCYGRGGSLSARQRTTWGNLSKTDEQRQRPTTGSAFAGMMSSPARGGKRRKLNNLDGQLRGDWRLFNALVDLMRKEAWGLLVVRPGPLGSSSWRCSLPSYSDFSYQSALWVHRTSFFLPFSLAPRSFWAGQRLPIWTCLKSTGTHVSRGWLHAWRGGATVYYEKQQIVCSKCPTTMDAVIRVASDLRSNPPPSIRLDEVCRLFGFINRSHTRQYLHNRVLDCQQYRVWCRSTNVQCGDYHSVLWTIFTNTLCVERGSINGTRIMGMGWNFFLFF